MPRYSLSLDEKYSSSTLLFITDYYSCSHFLQDYNHQTLKNQKNETNETVDGENEDDDYSDEEQDEDEEEEEEEDDEDPEVEEVENCDENEKNEDVSDKKRTEIVKQEQTITEPDLQVS